MTEIATTSGAKSIGLLSVGAYRPARVVTNDEPSRVIETEWSGRGMGSTTLYFPLVNTPMIAPTKVFEGRRWMIPEFSRCWVESTTRSAPAG